tara:strand:+ start:8986 stop:9330 length:345 start_codon:yes stop_codon:yes gene_type:complete
MKNLTAKNLATAVETRKGFYRLSEQYAKEGNFAKEHEAKLDMAKCQKIVDSFPTAPVSFYIGYRKYFEEVIKIGNSFFTRGEKMTKSRGFRNVVEIEKITQEMTNEMISDSHYY